MSYDDYLLKRDCECTFVDGMVLSEMPDADYREYVRTGLFFVDHHDALRLECNGGQIIATNREQFDILLDELSKYRESSAPRDREPDATRAAALMPDKRDFTK